MKLWKILALIIGIVVLIAGLFYLVMPVEDIEQDGVPSTTITFTVQKFDASNQVVDEAVVEWEMKNNEDVPTPVSQRLYPSTALPIGIPFLEPTERYRLDVTVTTFIIPQDPRVSAIDTTVTMEGWTLPGAVPIFGSSPGRFVDNDVPGRIERTETTIQSVDHDFFFDDIHPPHIDNLENYNNPSETSDIYGSMLDGATIWINVTGVAQVDPLIWGSLFQECVIEVGTGGTLDVQIVGVTATAPEYQP